MAGWARSVYLPTILVALTVGAGCADLDSGSDELSSASSIRFAPMETGPLRFAEVPFPSELYRDAKGRIAIGALPNPRSDHPLFAAIRDELARRSGFCASCNIVFGVDGELDPDTLPTSAEPGASASVGDAIALVDVDPSSPARGEAIPLRVQYDAGAGLLAVRPARGHVLHGGRRYAAVVTDRVRGSDGLPLAAAPALAALRDGEARDEREDALAASLDALADLGLPRGRVVGLAAFTTDDPAADLRAIRSSIQDAVIGDIAVDGVWTGAELDELLGIPETPGPGVDRPPQAGTSGTAALAHETTALVVAGSFAAPRFADGTGTEVGALVRAADGRPTPSGPDRVPFVLIVPEGAAIDRLPVVISQHGFSASRTTGFALADTVGAEGFAVLAIDAYQHGQRAESAVDRVHAMRGDVDGPDGFPETEQLDIVSRVFGLTGVPSDLTLHPGFPLAAFAQFAADVMSTVRLVRSGDLTALREADPRLEGLAFDPDRIVYVGNSMGAVVGTAVAVVEPDVHAFVLNVMPGSIVETLAESAEFRPLIETVLLPILGVEADFDEVERAMLFDPSVDLVRWVLEPVDPLALAPGLVRTDGPDLLVQLAGHDEVAAPTASESVVAAAGIPGLGTFAFAAVDSTSAPVRANLGGATIAAVRWDGAMHGMLEVSLQTSRWAEPLEPPLQQRAAVEVDNPIAAVHEQIAAFFRTFRDDGRATIDP
jgi:dienelactone hydrolase